MTATAILLQLAPEQIDQIADAVAQRLQPPRPLVPIHEAARELRVSERTVARLLAAGRLRGARAGKRHLVTRESIRELIDGRGQG